MKEYWTFGDAGLLSYARWRSAGQAGAQLEGRNGQYFITAIYNGIVDDWYDAPNIMRCGGRVAKAA